MCKLIQSRPRSEFRVYIKKLNILQTFEIKRSILDSTLIQTQKFKWNLCIPHIIDEKYSESIEQTVKEINSDSLDIKIQRILTIDLEIGTTEYIDHISLQRRQYMKLNFEIDM